MRKERLRFLGRATAASPQGNPSLTVEFLRSLGCLDKPRVSADLLRGDGFALDYPRRRLYCPLASPRTFAVGRKRHAHDLLARTVLFGLALLAEAKGPATLQRRGTGILPVTASLPGVQVPLCLHASAVEGPHGALVFCGHSTFGKSTISGRLLREWRQLEDDLAFLLVTPPGRRALATPRLVLFGTSELRVRTLPVAGLFWIQKARVFSLDPMPRAEAAAALLQPVLNWRRPNAVRNRLRMLGALLRAAPCRRLKFRKEGAPLRQLLRECGYLQSGHGWFFSA